MKIIAIYFDSKGKKMLGSDCYRYIDGRLSIENARKDAMKHIPEKATSFELIRAKNLKEAFGKMKPS